MVSKVMSCSLKDWLKPDTEWKDEFEVRTKTKVEYVLSVITGQRSESDHIIIDGHLFRCSYIICGNSETRTLELKFAPDGTDPTCPDEVTFEIKLPSSSGSSMRYLASDGNVILAQVQTDTWGVEASIFTYLMNMQSGQVTQLSCDIPEMVDCVVSSDWCLYRKDGQPSLATFYEVESGLRRILELTPYKEWPASLTLDPRPDHSHLLTYITSTSEPWKSGAEGYITQYDLRSQRVLTLNDNILLSSDILQYSPKGDIIMAHKKHPTCVVLFCADSLQQVSIIDYPQYCPFVDLPLAIPPRIDAILSCDTVARLPSAKIAIRHSALDPIGLKLRPDSAVLMWPVMSQIATCLAIIHINLGKPSELSMVDVYQLRTTDNQKEEDVL